MALRFTFLFFFILCFFYSGLVVNAQVITGNLPLTKTNIVAVNANNAEITVLDPTGFAISDRVLLIQTQGATINTTNTSSFGDVQNYNGAGNYEIATICGINGSDISFDYEMMSSFDPGAMVQMIKIPQFDNLTITGTLTADAWDGVTGGVLVLEAVSIDMLGNIDMNGKGFRGAAMENSSLNCSWINIFSGYAYGDPGSGAPKGEGIVVMAPAMSYGKGAAANGGGGGNDHNSGGGGGGNISSGGQGGTNGSTGFFDCKGNHPGVGGKGLSTTGRIFLGGGGGAGHGNNNLATPGGNGGGIVILIAQTLTGNNVFIRSNGDSALNTSYDANDPGGDAAGGGGSGGSVHLSIPSISGNITLEAIGGNGGDVVHTEANNDCFGPGGGGAGGLAKFDAAAPAAVTTVLTAGNNGTNQIIAGTSSCVGSSQSASAGVLGSVMTNVTGLPESTTDFAGCDISLAVELLNFDAIASGTAVELNWTTLIQENNATFILERSKNAIHFESIYETPGAGNSSERLTYHYSDLQPLTGQNYYRLKMINFDGSHNYSLIRTVRFRNGDSLLSVYPNPVKTGNDLKISIDVDFSTDAKITVFDILGQIHFTSIEQLTTGENLIALPTNLIGIGTFIIRLETKSSSFTKKVVLF